MQNNNETKKAIYLFGTSKEEASKVLGQLSYDAADTKITVSEKDHIVDITVTASNGDAAEKLHEQIRCSPLGAHIADEGVKTLKEAVVHFLKKHRLTLSLAESCSGGMCASKIVDVSGASDIFLGSVVSYADSAKMNLLGVDSHTLKRYGAVSEQTAKEMAQGAKARFGSDIAVSVTGIAGPGGGSIDKPVGTVCFGCSDRAGTTAVKIVFDDLGRDYIRAKSVEFMLHTILIHSCF
ncbi:MAG: CinA family protein [Clostridia bacterium]|nr:CinA family protein [Clostridia bacterium]